MKPVNLLPERHRPRSIRGESPGGAYVVLGALGAVLLAVVIYVLAGNQVTSKNDEAARAKAEAVQAEAQARSLGSFANFAQVKATREASVKSLASQRMDWERTMREIARVLPPKVFLTGLEASSSGASSAPASSGSSSAAADAATGPSVHITACAPSQRDVATTLVRLRQLAGAEEVKLSDASASGESGSSATGAGSAPQGGAAQGSSGSGSGCSDVTFNVTVTLDSSEMAIGSTVGEKVPASLGGGS